MKNNYIIYAPSFNENSGGSIVLHRLCDLLNSIGEKAYLWQFYGKEPLFDKKKPIRSLYILLRFLLQKWFGEYKTNPLFNTPIATKKHLHNSIVIYPEIVSGNPLKVDNIVRWFLHQPGYHTGEINYGKNELYFFYQDAFNNPSINVQSDNKLMVLYIRDDIYKQTNFAVREGSCYLIKKGKNKPFVHDMKNSICIDSMSHQEISKVFNQTEYFISYDTHTMYLVYALMCGCKSIVIPDEGISKEIWQPIEDLRSGISYGFDNKEYNENDKNKLFSYIKQIDDNTNNSVKTFVSKSELFFDNKI